MIEELGSQLCDLVYARVQEKDATRARSTQKEYGPSEIGVACLRRLAYMASGIAPVNIQKDKWAMILGTAVHVMLAEALESDPDWMVEKRLRISGVGDNQVFGSSDGYHIPTQTVVDHKVVGATILEAARKYGPDDKYRSQVHSYGRGWSNAGQKVKNVAILYWPKVATIDKRYGWSEKYDPQLAQDTVDRWTGIQSAAQSMDLVNHPERMESFPKTPEACHWCPWWSPSLANLHPGSACAGSDKNTADMAVLLGNPQQRS